MAKYQEGQSVIYESLSGKQEATVTIVYDVGELSGNKEPLYIIEWLPTGYTSVHESDIRLADSLTKTRKKK